MAVVCLHSSDTVITFFLLGAFATLVYLGLAAATPAIGRSEVVESSLVSTQQVSVLYNDLFLVNHPIPIHDNPAWAACTQPHITRDGYRDHGRTLTVQNSKFGQAHGCHYEFILCGARILALSAVGSLCESEAPWKRDVGKYW